jgi:hypothetical protein
LNSCQSVWGCLLLLLPPLLLLLLWRPLLSGGAEEGRLPAGSQQMLAYTYEANN